MGPVHKGQGQGQKASGGMRGEEGERGWGGAFTVLFSVELSFSVLNTIDV